MAKRGLAWLLGLLLILPWVDTCAEAEWSAEELLTVTIEGAEYVLGVSTAEDFAGWAMEREPDGVYGFQSPQESYFYVRTENGAPDAPIVCVDLLYADGANAVYCGIPCDPLLSADDTAGGTTLGEWLQSAFGARWNEDETLLEVEIPLGDGRVLLLATPGRSLYMELREAPGNAEEKETAE